MSTSPHLHQGSVALSRRQEQLVRELDAARVLGEPTTAARLAALMSVRHGVGKSQTYDLLSALRRKGVIALSSGEWARVGLQGGGR